MCDDVIHSGLVDDRRLTRRTFGLFVDATTGTAAIADSGAKPVTERDVAVRTADGTSDAALYYSSARGRWPAFLVRPNIMGLRPAFRDLGRRLAAQGYVMLVPNPFYRSKRAPVLDGPNPRKLLLAYHTTLSPDGIAHDAQTDLAFIEAQPQSQTGTRRRATVEGYPASHGWCVPARQAYDVPQAEPAWAALMQLYRTALA